MNSEVFLCQQCWNISENPILEKKYEKCREIIRVLANITAILYSKITDRSNSLILLFYVETYLLFRLLIDVFDKNSPIFHLPLHKLISHMPDQARRYSFQDLSTEDFEGIWKYMRTIYRQHSNNSGDVFGIIHKKNYFRTEFEKKYQNIKRVKTFSNSTVSNLLKKTILIPKAYASDDKFKRFLYKIRDYKLFEWYKLTESGDYEFNFTPKQNPSLFWCTTSNEEMIEEINKVAPTNPANKLWITTEVQPLKSSFSGTHIYYLHPIDEIKKITVYRKNQIKDKNDTRHKWLSNSSNRNKDIICQILNWDDSVISYRNQFPSPVDGSKTNWLEFEQQELKYLNNGIEKDFIEKKTSLGKRKRVGRPKTPEFNVNNSATWLTSHVNDLTKKFNFKHNEGDKKHQKIANIMNHMKNNKK